MNMEFNIGSSNDAGLSKEGRKTNILVVGNFSAIRADSADTTGDDPIRNMLNIDVLDLDTALARLRPSLSLGIESNPMDLTFSSMEDFHPDNLFRSQPAFSVISELKQSLIDPASAASATTICKELLGWSGELMTEPTPSADAQQQASGNEMSGDMFSRLLGESATRPDAPSTTVRSALDRILQDATSSDIVPENSAEIETLQDGLDAWCASAMRDLLRFPEFRQLEMAWRSLQWLGEQVEFDTDHSLWLVDVGAAAADSWAPDLHDRVTQTAGSADLLIVLNSYTDTPKSLRELRSLAAAAQSLGASAFAAASPALAGLEGTPDSITALDGSDIDAAESDEWQAVRADGATTQVGLAFPRILLRQPYGERSDPVDVFRFEELESDPAHDAFSWGNPAIALAAMSLQSSLQIEDLPMVTYDDGRGQAIKPPSEIYLTDSAGENLLRRGLIPLMAQRGHTGIRIPRIQSIAQPPTAL